LIIVSGLLAAMLAGIEPTTLGSLLHRWLKKSVCWHTSAAYDEHGYPAATVTQAHQ
jgi:hypothetical protein